MNRKRLAVLLTALFGGVGAALAVLMTGTTFFAPALRVGGAGGNASSASYATTGGAAEAAAGKAASAGYVMQAGFPAATAAAVFVVTSEREIDSSQDNTVTLRPPSGLILVEIPAGTFSEDVIVTVVIPETFPEAVSTVGELKGTSLGVEITNDKSLQPVKPVTLTFTYRDADIRGFREDRLRVAYYIPAQRRWVLLPTTIDAANNKISATVRHFSIFRVVEIVPAVSLGEPFVYPNPLRPALGHTALNISNLPENVEIRIYTLAGDLVRTLTTDVTGRAAWDGLTEDGEKAASGLYLALARRGSETKTIKIAVER